MRIIPVLIASAGVLLSAACTTTDIVEGAITNRQYIGDSVQKPLSVADARNTFLLRSSSLFYPDGLPADPSVLPELTEQQILAIEKMLNGSLARVIATQTKHRTLLATHFGGFNDTRARGKLKVLAQGSAIAGTEETGRMFVDAKVVQAMYRSALLSVLVDTEDPGENREGVAFERFAAFTDNLKQMSSVQPLTDARAFIRGIRESESGGLDSLLAGAFSLLEARLHDMALVSQSRQLETSFLSAIEFLMAHETAHLVLGHFPLTNECEIAQKRELDADLYAMTVNGLARFDRLPTLVLRGSPTGFTAGAALFADATPRGHEAFFRHAYGLAGFDSGMSSIAGCSYPAPEERESGLSAAASVLADAVETARFRHAQARMLRQKPVAADAIAGFDEYFEAQLQEAADGGPLEKQLQANRELLKVLYVAYYRK